MKRTVLSAALTLSLALSGAMVFAQQPQPQPQAAPDTQQPAPPPPQHRFHKPNPERETARLTRQLNLSPEQATKLQPILADRDQKMAALWSNQDLAPQDKHQQMHAIQQSTRQQLESVLTPDQLQQMRAMHHGRHGSPDAGPNAGPGQS